MHSSTRTLALHADLHPRDCQPLDGFTCRDVMRSLLRSGYEHLALDGPMLEDLSPPITLFVEEDAEFLLEAYVRLEQLLQTQASFEHAAFLGDGALTLDALAGPTDVQVELRYAPSLDVRDLVSHTASVSRDEYTCWWRSIAHQLLTAS